MESFFNDTYTLEALAQSWADRQAALKKEEEQEFCDMLYKSIRDNVLAQRESIFEELKGVIDMATDRSQLKIRLWSYKQATLLQWYEDREVYHSKITALKEMGEEWTISNVAGTKEMRVVDVIRKTDILSRLALLFGPNFVVTDTAGGSREVSGVWKTTRRILTLHYYPGGAMGWTPTAMKYRAARDKYRDRPLRDEEPTLNAGSQSLTPVRAMELRRVVLGY